MVSLTVWQGWTDHALAAIKALEFWKALVKLPKQEQEGQQETYPLHCYLGKS